MANYNKFTRRQKVFMYDTYVKTESCSEVCRRFQDEFPTIPNPNGKIVKCLVKKFRVTGSLHGKWPKPNKTILTKENLLNNTASFTRSSKKSPKCIVQKKMDKTPVTILQELMVKQLCIPAYEEINKLPERGFVIRVKCKDLCADGTGLNKKEAKHAAAKKMLSLIAENDKSKSIPSTVLPVLNSEHKSLSNTTKAQPCQPQMINYVGLLNEFCAKYKFPSPEYNVNSYGPPFTMTCRVHNIKEEATANNKKEAKQEVSHKVYDRLNKNNGTINNLIESVNGLHVEILDIQNDSLKKLNTRESNIAKALYKTIPKKDIVVVSPSAVNHYHLQLQSFFFNKIMPKRREILENKLHMLSETRSPYNPKTLLDSISAILNKKIQRIVFKSINVNLYIVGYRLISDPVVTQVAMGETKDAADLNAVTKLVYTIFMLMQ